MGRGVVDFAGTLDRPRQTAYALRIGYDDKADFATALKRLAATPGASELETLVIGTWAGEMYDSDSASVVQALASVRDQLVALKHVFLGEITYEEFEISWIVQSDLSPLLAAYPRLEWLAVRGGSSLAFQRLQHQALRGLVVETGGLSGKVVAQILSGQLPALQHLELWLGSDSYGGDSSVADLQPLLGGTIFPQLTHLGLCNAEYSDDILAAVAQSPLLDRLESLDLSRGTLGDEGCRVLMQNSRFAHLKRIDLSDNYLTPSMVAQIGEHLLTAVLGEQRDPQENDGLRYCSVSE